MTTNDQNAAPVMNISRSRIRTDQPSNPHNDAIIDGMHDVRQALTAAYQQGREDLADQIRTAVAPFYDSPHGKYLAPLMSKIRTILINAGGH